LLTRLTINKTILRPLPYYTYDSMYRLASSTADTNSGSALTATYTYTDDL